MRLAARFAARSDIGLNRQTNEDAWLVRPPLFAVADGMGGAQAGEVASRVALQTLSAVADSVDPQDRPAAGEALAAAAHDANRRVWDLSTEYASQAGMGTTLTALALCTDGARLAHIGDSRAYLLRDGALTQITADHSLVAEMVRNGELEAEEVPGHPLRSVLSRALGTEPEPVIDVLDVDLLPGDALLLCSDGLTGPVPAERIGELLELDDPEQAAAALVAAALEAGGPDNITVVVLRLEEAPPTAIAPMDGAAAITPAIDADETAEIAPADAEQTAEITPIDAGETAEITPPIDAGETAELVTPREQTGPPDTALEAQTGLPAAKVEVEEPPVATPPATPPPDTASSHVAPAPPPAAARRASGRRRWLLRLAVVVIILVVIAAGVLVLGQLEWVGVDEDGFVTVYRGLPWEFAGLRLYRVHERALTLRYDALPAARRREVDARTVGWPGSGERLVQRLREAQ